MGEGEPSMEQESKENNKNLFTKPLTFYMLQMRTPGMLEERNPQMDIGVPLDVRLRLGGMPTVTTLDSGSGVCSCNKGYILQNKIPILEKMKLPNPFSIVVGDSGTYQATEAWSIMIEEGKQKAKVWFIPYDYLPVPALLGYKMMERLKMTTGPNVPKWNGIPLSATGTKVGMYCQQTKEEQQKRLYPVNPHVTIKIPMGRKKAVKIKVKNPPSPEAYYFPNYTTIGRLFVLPGIVDFDQENGEAIVMYGNPTNRNIKIKSDALLGHLYFMMDEDVSETHLIEFGNKSLMEEAKPNLGPDEEKRRQLWQKRKPLVEIMKKINEPTEKKTINVKVGLNYHKALPEHLFLEEEEQSQVQPQTVLTLMARTLGHSELNKDFERGFTMASSDMEPDPIQLNDVIQLMG